jgi:hypothetical protein
MGAARFQLADYFTQLLSQRFGGEMELDQLTFLKLHLGAFQVFLDGLAKLVGSTHPFSGQDGKHTG